MTTRQAIIVGGLISLIVLVFAVGWLNHTSTNTAAETPPAPGGKDYSTATATTAPSTTPAPPQAQTTPTRVPNVPLPAAGCVTTGQAKAAIGLDIVREGSEPCGFEWRSNGAAVVEGKVASGWIATLHMENNVIQVVTQPGTYRIKAGTWRFMAAYPLGDPARDDACGLLAKEQQFGQQEDPSFKVEAGSGLNCSGGSSPSTSTSSATMSGLRAKCPEAASVISSAGWVDFGSNGWKYNGASISFTAPAGTVVDYDGGRAQAGQNVPSGITFTMYCQQNN